METTLEKESTIESLKAEVSQLKKDLKECLDGKSPELECADRHDWTLGNAIAGLLQPAFESRQGKQDVAHKYYTWGRFQNVLLARPEFAELWTSQEFREVIVELNAVVEALNEARLMDYQKNHSFVDIGTRIAHCTASEQRGWMTLKNAVSLLYSIEESDRLDLEKKDVDELYICLHIISEVQRLHLAQKQADQ